MEHSRIVANGLPFLPSAHLPAPAVMAILGRFEREQIATFITVAVDLLDAIDGDPDLEVEDPAGETIPVIDDPEVLPEEDDGDPDLEEIGAEDSFMVHHGSGPGCPISDPAEESDPQGQCDEDGINTYPAGILDGHGPGCIISDNDFEHDGGEPDYEPHD